MLINLTNHPSSQWSTEQLEAAKQYGKVYDYPFPMVSPDMTTEEVEHLALCIYADVVGNYGTDDLTIHLMGEFTLTYKLINLFHSEGIACIASTTERIVNVHEDGTKEVKFNFVRFREYD